MCGLCSSQKSLQKVKVGWFNGFEDSWILVSMGPESWGIMKAGCISFLKMLFAHTERVTKKYIIPLNIKPALKYVLIVYQN